MMDDGVETENSDATFRAHTAHTWLFDLVSSYFILFHVISCYLVLSKCRNFKKMMFPQTWRISPLRRESGISPMRELIQ